MRKLAEDALRKPGKGEKLSPMGVPGKLQAHSGLLNNRQPVGHVTEQNAGAGAVYPQSLQGGAHANGKGSVVVRYSNNLQTVDINFFIRQDTNPSIGEPGEKFPGIKCRALSVQFMDDDIVAMFELTVDDEEVKVVEERHYKLVPAEELDQKSIRLYR